MVDVDKLLPLILSITLPAITLPWLRFSRVGIYLLNRKAPALIELRTLTCSDNRRMGFLMGVTLASKRNKSH